MSSSIPISLRSYIEQEIVPRYEHFDAAHQTDHVRTVMEESMRIARHYEVDTAMVYTVAACHDIGLCEGREHHHEVSARMLKADRRMREWFTEEQIAVMCEAVEDHRASSSHEPRSIYGKIVAEADRIIDPHVTLLRTVQYGLSHYPELSKEQQYRRFLQHLHEKYAEGGYLKLWIPYSSNAAGLQKLRGIIADEGRLAGIFEELWNNEAEKQNNL